MGIQQVDSDLEVITLTPSESNSQSYGNSLMVQVTIEDGRCSPPLLKSRFVVVYSNHRDRERVARTAGWAMNSKFRMILEPAPEL